MIMPEYLNALRKTNKGSTLVFDNKKRALEERMLKYDESQLFPGLHAAHKGQRA